MTQSVSITKSALKFNAGFAIVQIVGSLYTLGSPPNPPVKAYNSSSYLAMQANPSHCKKRSNICSGILSGKL